MYSLLYPHAIRSGTAPGLTACLEWLFQEGLILQLLKSGDGNGAGLILG